MHILLATWYIHTPRSYIHTYIIIYDMHHSSKIFKDPKQYLDILVTAAIVTSAVCVLTW